MLGQDECDANKDLEQLTVLIWTHMGGGGGGGAPNHNLLLLDRVQLGPKCCP